MRKHCERNSLLIFGLVLLVCSFAHGQNSRWDLGAPGSAGAVTVSGSGLAFLVAEPNVSLQWCNFPANTVPCTNYANTYPSLSSTSPCPTNAPIVLQGSNTCVATGDTFGNLGVYTPAGTYAYTLVINGVAFGPYVSTVSVTGPGGTNCELQANNNGVFAGVPNTCANFSTGDIVSTANITANNLFATNAATAAEFISAASNPASTGTIRLANGDLILWRNAGNTANYGFGATASDQGTASFAGGFGLTGAIAKLWFGGFTSSFPMLKPISTGLTLRLGDDSADAGPFEALSFKVNGSQAVTGLQGSTGTNFFVCAGSLTSGHLVKSDANGNCADAGGGFTQIEVQTFGSTCSTGNTNYYVCTTTYTWTTPFADSGYIVSCNLTGTITGYPYLLSAVASSSTQVAINISNGTNTGAAVSSASGVYCIGIHP